MPDVSSKKFVQILQTALAKSGHLSQADVDALKSAQSGIHNTIARMLSAAAFSVVL